jgi:hypothetical protein
MSDCIVMNTASSDGRRILSTDRLDCEIWMYMQTTTTAKSEEVSAILPPWQTGRPERQQAQSTRRCRNALLCCHVIQCSATERITGSQRAAMAGTAEKTASTLRRVSSLLLLLLLLLVPGPSKVSSVPESTGDAGAHDIRVAWFC